MALRQLNESGARGLEQLAEHLAPLMKPRREPATLELDLAAIQSYRAGKVDGGYHQRSRPEMQVYVPAATRQLLDIGCSEGRFGEAIMKRIPRCEVWGVEPSDAAKVAAQRLTRVLNEPFTASTDLPAGVFDVVTMNDSLEHIFDTDGALQAVKRLLRPDGLLIASLPNVSYCMNVKEMVLNNDWRYRDDGVLDRTHVRFFTTKSAGRLLEGHGFIIELVKGIHEPGLSLRHRIAVAIPLMLFPSMRHSQFAIVARKPT